MGNLTRKTADTALGNPISILQNHEGSVAPQRRFGHRSFPSHRTPEVERFNGLLGVMPNAIGDLILVEVVQASATRSNPLVCMRRAASAPRQGVHSLQVGNAHCEPLEAEQIGRDHAPDQDV